MISALFFLLVVLVLGFAPTAGILASRTRDAKRWRGQLVAYELRFPRGLDPAAVQVFLAGLSGLAVHHHQRPFVARGVMFETSASSEGIWHHLLIPRTSVPVVMTALRAALPGVAAVPDEEYRPTRPTRAAEMALSHLRRPLVEGQVSHASTRILAGLQPLNRGERVVVQWSAAPMGPVMVPSRRESPSILQTFLSHLWDGFAVRPPDSEEVKAARAKHSSLLFLSAGRIGVVAATPARAGQILHRMLAVYRSISGPGVHLYRRRLPEGLVVRAIRERRTPILATPCVLNTTELATLAALPVGEVAVPGLRLAGSRQLAPSADIPSGGRIVAEATFPGAERPLALSVSDSLRHTHVLGPTGVGKSTLLLGLITQDMQAGRGVVVIEPKGDLVADVLDRVPDNRVGDVVVLDLADDERPVGLNPLSAAHLAPDLVSDQMLGLFAKLYASSWGNRTADILRVGLRTLATRPGSTLVDLPLLLTDPRRRQQLTARIGDPILRGFWNWYDGLSEGERGAALGPVMNKLRAWLLSPRLRNVLGQAEPRFDLGRALEQRKIILVPLARGLVGAESAALVGSLVVNQLWNAVQGRANLPAEKRPATCTFVDEFQDYVNLPTDLAEILAQARGLGLSLTLAHQHLAQLPSGIREAVLANARSKIFFQLGGNDARALAKDLAPHLTADDLMGLGAYEIVATLSAGSRVAPPVTGRTLPPPPATGQGEAAREASRQRYGVPRDEVEAAIRERHEGRRRRPGMGREVSS